MLRIVYVNRDKVEWNPNAIFTNLKVRAIVKRHFDLVTNIMNESSIRNELEAEYGHEGHDTFMMEVNELTGMMEVLLPSSAVFLKWRIDDNKELLDMFEVVEQHTDDQQRIDEQEPYEPVKKPRRYQSGRDLMS